MNRDRSDQRRDDGQKNKGNSRGVCVSVFEILDVRHGVSGLLTNATVFFFCFLCLPPVPLHSNTHSDTQTHHHHSNSTTHQSFSMVI